MLAWARVGFHADNSSSNLHSRAWEWPSRRVHRVITIISPSCRRQMGEAVRNKDPPLPFCREHGRPLTDHITARMIQQRDAIRMLKWVLIELRAHRASPPRGNRVIKSCCGFQRLVLCPGPGLPLGRCPSMQDKTKNLHRLPCQRW